MLLWQPKTGKYFLNKNETLRENINAILSKEGLQWNGRISIKHLLSVLAQDVGITFLKSQVKHSFNRLKIAAHYGCHALRPSNITQFDNPLNPTIFEKLVIATGARNVCWPMRLECCGNPLLDKDKLLSLSLMNKKVANALQAGADVICAACTHCLIQFSTEKDKEQDHHTKINQIPCISYSQLLGLSLGLPEKALGLSDNSLGTF